MKRLLTALAFLATLAVPAGVVSAHHPVITGVTECLTDTWSVTWSVASDGPWAEQVRIVSPAGYGTDWQPVDTVFTRTANYPGGQAQATETVTLEWSNGVTSTASASVDRPPPCPTPSTTSATTTSTEAPSSPSTTLPPPGSGPAPDTTSPPESGPTSSFVAPTTTAANPTTPSSASTTSTQPATSTSTIPVAVGEPPVPPGPIVLWETPGDIVRITAVEPAPATQLPATGGGDSNRGMVYAAALLLLAGGGAVAVSRRRPS